jgi:hypothetical protein
MKGGCKQPVTREGGKKAQIRIQSMEEHYKTYQYLSKKNEVEEERDERSTRGKSHQLFLWFASTYIYGFTRPSLSLGLSIRIGFCLNRLCDL